MFDHRHQHSQDELVFLVDFVVKNNGKEKHNFRVKGNGVDERFLLDVKPSDSKVMHITLKPGMYEITCPDNERALGMKRTLTVE